MVLPVTRRVSPPERPYRYLIKQSFILALRVSRTPVVLIPNLFQARQALRSAVESGGGYSSGQQPP